MVYVDLMFKCLVQSLPWDTLLKQTRECSFASYLHRGITSLANSSIERLTVAWSISPP